MGFSLLTSWSGEAIPWPTCYLKRRYGPGYMLTFLPRIDVLGGDSAQNCSYRYSGRVRDQNGSPLQGIAVRGLPGNPVTDVTGFYSTTLLCDKTGQAEAFKSGFAFSPVVRPYGPGRSLQHVGGQDFVQSGERKKSLLPGILMLLLEE